MTAPYTGIQLPQPGQSLQRQRRAWRIFTDQHGRRFGAQADMASNTPIAEFIPQDGVLPPWLPTMRHAKFAQTGDLEFRWDYDAVAEDWSALAASYYDEAIKMALTLPGDIPVPDVGGIVDKRIRAYLGPPPLSPAIPLACKLGDPWILGRGPTDALGLKAVLEQQTGASGQEALKLIQQRLDAAAAEAGVERVPTIPERPLPVERARSITDLDANATFAPVTYQAFMAEAKQRGTMTHAEAAIAWDTHKRNLAAEEAAA